MATTFIRKKKLKKKLKDPILVEGLPGIGFVGKIAAEHLVRELKATKVAELYSYHFPHQVMMRKDGTIRMLKYRMYVINLKKNDLLVLIGDLQPMTSEAQYDVSIEILKYFKSLGGRKIMTLGGYSTGIAVKKARVLGAATSKKVAAEYSKQGIVFGEAKGAILGAAGLLIGLGAIMGMEGVCLMGETHGAYIDAQGAKVLLSKLKDLFGLKLDLSKIEERAKSTEKVIKKIENEMKREKDLVGKRDELSYIR